MSSVRHGLTLACLLAGCSGDLVDDQLFVRSGTADLPVQVRGDVSGGTLLLYENGGPGGTAIDIRLVDYVDWGETIEPHTAIAYYDRRGTGNGHGRYAAGDLDLDQLPRDLHAVQRVLRERYDLDRVVLMSHSFGGWVSLRYQLDHPRAVEGWLAVSPAVVGGDANFVPYRRDFACRMADEAALPGVDWTAIQAWCAAHPSVDPEGPEKDELWEHLDTIYAALPLDEPALRTGPLLGAVFGSHYNLWDSHLGGDALTPEVWEAYAEADLLDDAGAVNTPTLVMNGDWDDLVPTELAAGLEAELGGPSRLLAMPRAGHLPFVDRPADYAEAVLGFVDELEGG